MSELKNVEGLDTVAVQHLRSVDGKWYYGEAEYANQDERELVIKSQAESIINYKNKRINEISESLERVSSYWKDCCETISKLQDAINESQNEIIDMTWQRRRSDETSEDLEKKIEVAKKFIQFCCDGFFVSDHELQDAAIRAMESIK